MKNYKQTIKLIRKHEEWQIKFLNRIASKLANNAPDELILRIFKIKGRIEPYRLMELLSMQILEDKIEAKKYKGSNVVKFRSKK